MQPSTTVAGVSIAPPVTVEILDAAGNPVPSATNAITLALATNPGGSTLGGTLTVNAVNGVATFSDLTLNQVGTGYTLSASSSGLAGAASNAFNVISGAAGRLAFLVQPGSTIVGTVITPPVVVEVLDGNGNLEPAANNAVTLALAANPGNSTLGGTVTVNAVNGVATFSTLTLNKTGTGYMLSASTPGLAGAVSNAFNIISGAATQLAFQVQPSSLVVNTIMAPAVKVQVEDADGHLVANATNQITLALATNPGGSTLGGVVTMNAVNGVATFNTLTLNKVGNGYTLSASATGLTGATSTAFNVVSGAPAKLAFQGQPSTTIVGSTMTPAVTVLVQDGIGNLLPAATNAVTLALATNPGGSTLGGTVTVSAVNGVATFNTLTLNKVGSGYTLAASAAGLTGATSSAFNVSPGPPAQLAFQVQPSTTLAGSAITPAVTVQVLDANGNPVPTATNMISLALAANPGGGTLGGTLTVNAVNGVATFSTLTLSTSGIGYTLAATSIGLFAATSAAFTITPVLPLLSLTKSVSPANAAPGGTVTYTLNYVNIANAAVSNVILSDILPAHISYVSGSASGNGSYAAATNTLSWSLGTLNANGTGQVTFQAIVASTAALGSTISNTAQITCAQKPSPVPSNSAAFSVMTVSLQVSPLTLATQGQPVTLSASVSGGSKLVYKFTALYTDTNGNEQVVLIQDYAASSTCTWIPALGETYTLVASVREIGETVACDVYATVSGYVVNSALSALAIQGSPASPAFVNLPITLTAAAKGGANVKYQFWLYNPAASPAWSQLQGYSSSAACIWTPTVPGNYLISATAQDSATGTVVNTLLWDSVTGPLTAVSVTASPPRRSP